MHYSVTLSAWVSVVYERASVVGTFIMDSGVPSVRTSSRKRKRHCQNTPKPPRCKKLKFPLLTPVAKEIKKRHERALLSTTGLEFFELVTNMVPSRSNYRLDKDTWDPAFYYVINVPIDVGGICDCFAESEFAMRVSFYGRHGYRQEVYVTPYAFFELYDREERIRLDTAHRSRDMCLITFRDVSYDILTEVFTQLAKACDCNKDKPEEETKKLVWENLELFYETADVYKTHGVPCCLKKDEFCTWELCGKYPTVLHKAIQENVNKRYPFMIDDD